MATKPVRIDFRCRLTTLTYTHALPSHLITADPSTQNDPKWVQDFVAAIQPLVKEHEEDGKRASGEKCGVCGGKMNSVTMTPMSFLHQVDDPFINIYVNPVCRKPECDLKTRQEISDVMAMIGQNPSTNRLKANPGGPNIPGTEGRIKEGVMCQVCGQVDGVKRCARCGVVAYCGKEHQVADWKTHKRICKAPERG